ncbi:MAG: glycosyltransferase [Candidatus Humimicrobiaceae bacterium]
MRILIVAMGNSIHLARWVSQINDQGWDIHLFPTESFVAVNPEIKNVKIHIPLFIKLIVNFYKNRKQKLTPINEPMYIQETISVSIAIKEILRSIMAKNNYKKLNKLIKKIKPDIIHSMHIQEAGYLTLESKKNFEGKFPKWIVTNWGSDIDLFRNIGAHNEKISEVLSNCDYYSCECERDIEYAKNLGFKGTVLPVLPNSGGIDFNLVNSLKSNIATSKRKIILLKGYQNWSGRALVGLRALERCADILSGYIIYIYSSEDFIDVKISANLLTKKTGIKTIILPNSMEHNEILKFHGLSRISIGLSITDAISTSMLEAMVMGSFPIQSKTACANEWFKDGKTGILVEPEDPEDVEKAIRMAISDDSLVDNASKLNYDMLYDRIEKSKIKKIVVNYYRKIAKSA